MEAVSCLLVSQFLPFKSCRDHNAPFMEFTDRLSVCLCVGVRAARVCEQERGRQRL